MDEIGGSTMNTVNDRLTASFDGSCEWHNGKRNPGGLATYGWTIFRGDKTVAWGYGEVCRGEGATNNVAEYNALLSLMKAYRDLGLTDPIYVTGDSQLVIRQLSGQYRVKAPLLIPLHQQVKKAWIPGMTLAWVPREENEHADNLSKTAYNMARVKPDNGPWEERYKHDDSI